jgi:uncharacterized HAD superfamily protein
MNPVLICKGMVNNLVHGKWKLITTEEAIHEAREWTKQLPRRYDLIVGIPRAGLLFATFISQNLGVPLSTPDRLPQRWNGSKFSVTKPIKNILLVEDCTGSGSEILFAKQKAETLFPDAKVQTGSVYAVESFVPDTYGKQLNGHQRFFFEWDLMYLGAVSVASDLDGVICQDWPFTEDISEDSKLNWMRTVAPFMIPAYGVKAIITSRPERYRQTTTDWLRKHEVLFSYLIMDQSSQDVGRDYIGHKVQAINQICPDLFFESHDSVAREVHFQTGVPVVSIESMRLYQ